MATLTKETALVVLPAFGWAVAQNLDRRNRAQVVAVAAFGGLLLMAMYPLYALYKGELLPGPGHSSLLETARWQLLQRQASGSVLDPHSQTRQLLEQWLGLDRYLLLAGLAAVPVALLATRLRPAALALGIQWLLLLRGGYMPFMHVVTLLPWSALILVGAVEVLAGNPAVLGSRSWPGWWPSRPRWLRAAAAGLVAVPLTVCRDPVLDPAAAADDRGPAGAAAAVGHRMAGRQRAPGARGARQHLGGPDAALRVRPAADHGARVRRPLRRRARLPVLTPAGQPAHR
jgi:hypothetical protein